jgi:hypothetical protein
MSVLAGLLLILYGAYAFYLGYLDIAGAHVLTRFAAFVTAGLGVLLALIGLAHFKAPHKAFLASVAALLCFHIQMYFNALFLFARPLWPWQASLLSLSLCILLLSYLGYARKTRRATV